ncbi:hypothetical protein PRIPAC_73549 [Pristionchus pacificus]|uniref:Uncharacterized protein n=1 Tax=Pristionchus pacificus TaxID=54126 RepID=A0A2A6CF58_PRIPA|nr:hypothetical protein PRIPAC_73549 [Pristionchus pacificus]|eukprot:PDM76693.1 hypothetical protein PRIPAC_42088 [Pristionchus pacificus]
MKLYAQSFSFSTKANSSFTGVGLVVVHAANLVISSFALQSLFGCLRKYDFDSLPCGKQNEANKECVKASAKAAAEYKETVKEGARGEGSSQSMTKAQFNKVMQLFPHADIGQSPYKQMKLFFEMDKWNGHGFGDKT